MMDRQDVHPRELLSAYLDGELPEAGRKGVEAHLADCSSCSALLQDFQAVAAAAAREQPPKIPADLRARIRLKIATREPGGAPLHRHPIRSHGLGLAAAAGVVLVIGLWAMRQELAPPGVPAIAPDNMGETGPTTFEREPAPPPAAPVTPGGGMRRLKSLGYVGGESQPKKGPSPSAPDRQITGETARKNETGAPLTAREAAKAEEEALRTRPSVEANDLTTSSTAPGTAAPAAGPRDDVAAGRAGVVRMQAKTAGAAPSSIEPLVRTLLFQYPTYRVSVFEDGTVALSAKGYACNVRRDGPSVDADIASLFVLASSTAGETAGAPGRAARAAPVVRLLEPPATAGRAAGETAPSDLPAGRGVEIETRLKVLLRDRYLALMEDRCGATPQAVRSP